MEKSETDIPRTVEHDRNSAVPSQPLDPIKEEDPMDLGSLEGATMELAVINQETGGEPVPEQPSLIQTEEKPPIDMLPRSPKDMEGAQVEESPVVLHENNSQLSSPTVSVFSEKDIMVIEDPGIISKESEDPTTVPPSSLDLVLSPQEIQMEEGERVHPPGESLSAFLQSLSTHPEEKDEPH